MMLARRGSVFHLPLRDLLRTSDRSHRTSIHTSPTPTDFEIDSTSDLTLDSDSALYRQSFDASTCRFERVSTEFRWVGHLGERVDFTWTWSEKCKPAPKKPNINNPRTTRTTATNLQSMATPVTPPHRYHHHNLTICQMGMSKLRRKSCQARRGKLLTARRNRVKPHDLSRHHGKKSRWKDLHLLSREEDENHHAQIESPWNCSLKPISDKLARRDNRFHKSRASTAEQQRSMEIQPSSSLVLCNRMLTWQKHLLELAPRATNSHPSSQS